jgi:branched-chain amino acid transport system substrate-binding protein
VIVVDDGTDPARYQAGLKDLVETRHVFAFVAQFAPFTVEAGNKYLEKVRVPVIGGDCAGAPWYASPMLFPQCTGFIQQLFGIANQGVVLAHKKRFGDLYCAEAPVCAAGDKTYNQGGLARAAGTEPVYSDQISIADPDYTAQCLRARSVNVEILTVIADVNTVGRVAASCDRQDYHPIYIQGSGTTNAELAHRAVMDGTLVQLNAFPPLVNNSPASAEYQSVVRRYAPSLEPAPYTTQGWTAAKLFQKAAEMAGEPLTRERLLEALWSMKGETLGGLAPPLTFIKNKPPPQSRCWFVMKMSKGQFVAPWGSRTFCRR